MSICSRCGEQLEGKERYCVHCGQIQHKPAWGESFLAFLEVVLFAITLLLIMATKH